MDEVRRELLQSLGEKMALVMKGIHAGQTFRFSDYRLGPPHVRILFFVAKQKKDVAVKDLAEMLRVTPGAITQLVNMLVEKDLVKRVEDAKDRRVIRIKLTDLGASSLEEFNKGYMESTNKVFGVLNEKEIKEFVRILDKVNAHLYQKGAI